MAHRKRTLLPIGIHLNADAVYMVQLEYSEGEVVVVSKAARQFDLGPPAGRAGSRESADTSAKASDGRFEQAREFIRAKITKDGFRGKDAVVSLPAERLVIQHVRMAPLQPEELAGGLPTELKGKLPFDPDEAVIRHIIAGTISENNETKQDVIVLAAQRGSIEKEVTAMFRLGLRVVGIGVEPCAMCYPYAFAASHAAPTQDGPPSLMLVYLAPRAIYVAIVRGQDTTFVKGVEIGTEHLVEAIASAKKITPQEAEALRTKWRAGGGNGVIQEAVETYNGLRTELEHIVDEIESCMRYHTSLARGSRVDRLLFLGPEARDRALVRVLGAHLGVSCEVGNPLGAILESGTPSEAEPEMAVAAGLSLFTAQ